MLACLWPGGLVSKRRRGCLSYNELCRRLRGMGIEMRNLHPAGKQGARLPFVSVFGRRDSTISYMGANIYPTV